MPRNYIMYLEDILKSSNKIIKYVGDASYDEFFVDEMRLEAITRNFEIIGIAASNIPQEIKEKYTFIDWRKIINFRNILAHEYFGIDYEVMWNIIKNNLPELIVDIKKILEGLE
ncbi:MAG: DUF86 domain-containing protein [Nitrospirae bacterium]|nr:DUF86 domain-containing protein [Nitrospirota bacterium]MBF0542703.1 DUF86 domain-containing protein [Nitrospirota bacterium]